MNTFETWFNYWFNYLQRNGKFYNRTWRLYFPKICDYYATYGKGGIKRIRVIPFVEHSESPGVSMSSTFSITEKDQRFWFDKRIFRALEKDKR